MPAAHPDDEAFMRRALQLAAAGRGWVEPNPMVGCVIVKSGRVIGEGRHEQFGAPHAEPNALVSCTEDPLGSTAYVTLEPCSHTQKKTPPCVPRLVEARVARVVVGCEDPNPLVSGRGVRALQSAGIAVTVGVCEADCRQINSPFFAGVRCHRPYVTLKWAESADGKVAGPGGRRVQITNAASTQVVHEMRSRCDAILVGINTVLNDDPLLTPRRVEIRRPLLRVILDTRLRIPLSSRLVQTARECPTMVCCLAQANADASARIAALQELGVRVVALSRMEREDPPRVRIPPLLSLLYREGVTHLIVEPGPCLAKHMIEANLADRVWVFRSPHALRDASAPAAARVFYPTAAEVVLAGDRLTEYLNPSSGVYFAPTPSADLFITTGSTAIN